MYKNNDREAKSCSFTDTSWAVRVSPTTSNRIVEAAKGILTTFVADVFITTDSRKGKSSGK